VSRMLTRSVSEGFQRPAFCILNSAFCILFAGCSPSVTAQPNSASPAGGALEVVMAGPPTRKPLALISTQPARIEAIEQAPIHSKVAAYVAEVAVDYGDKVTKDQPLIKLSAPEMDAELAQKNALLAQAKAELVQAQSAQRAAEAAIVTAKSQATQFQARLERTQSDVERWRLQSARIQDLATSGSVTRQLQEETHQNFAAAQAAHKESTAAIESAQAVVVQTEAQSAKAAADVEAAQARVQVAAANLAHAQALLSYLTVKAPFAGVITNRNIDPGHFVQPAGASGQPLLVVARVDKMRIFVAIPEVEVAFADLGDDVLIEVQSLRGEALQGKVTKTSFALGKSSRALDAIIDIENAEGRLRPGMYATAKITLAERKDALTLPIAAVVRQGREAFCYKLIGGKAAKTPLTLGIQAQGDFEITAGLSENDTVILNKASSLKDGQPVDVLKTDAKKA
jgi:HlyD family secretion protein